MTAPAESSRRRRGGAAPGRRSSVAVVSERALAVQAVVAVVRDGRNLDTALTPITQHPTHNFIHTLTFKTMQ